MKTLYLIRHSLTGANEQHLYCGHTDISLSENGRRLAVSMASERPLPECDIYATSGMKRTCETLSILTGVTDFEVMPDLMEMNFGTFEMRSYEQLSGNPDYIRWIEDESGCVACPGGESRRTFSQRIQRSISDVLLRNAASMMIVCHGGVIANIMQNWFPEEDRHFYQWQPKACRGYAVTIENGKPVGFEAL